MKSGSVWIEFAVVAFALVVLGAGRAEAEPQFGPLVDAFCTQNDRIPATPYADLVDPAVFFNECTLCHQPGTYDTSNTVEPEFTEFKRAQSSGDFSFFCPDSATPVENTPPTLDPIGDHSVGEGEPLSILISGSDPDGDGLTFTAANDPTGSTLTNNGNGTAQFSWTPGFDQSGTFPVTFIVTDDGTPPENASESITITVGNVNRPPVLDAVGSPSVQEGEELVVPLQATDPDGDRLTFTGSNLPTGSSLVSTGNTTAEFRWTPGFDGAGAFPVTFMVTDNGVPTESDSESVTITVGNANRAPVLDPVGNRSLNAGESLVIQLTALDPDGDAMSITATNPPSGATLTDRGDGTAEFTWTPGLDQAGSFPVTFIVTDDWEMPASDSEEITITVGDTNRPPVLDPVGNRALEEGQTLTLAMTASDADGDPLTFVVDPMPQGATLTQTPSSAELVWTPGSGSHPLTLIVSDGQGGSDSEPITVTVGAANRPPVLEPVGNRSVNEGEELVITATASDPDGDPLEFAFEGAPAGALLSQTGNTAQFVWTPGPGEAGNYPMACSVTDPSGGSDSESFTVTVGAVNRAPELGMIGNRSVQVGDPLEVVVGASDADGDALTFEIQGLPSGASFVDNGDATARFLWTPGVDQVGTHDVTFTVFDEAREWDSETIAIVVTQPAPPGDLDLAVRARWNGDSQMLHVRAGRVDPRTAVEIVDAGSGATLTRAMADERGNVRVRTHPLVPPCSVQLRVGDQMTSATLVKDAPANCGATGPGESLRMKTVEWNEAKRELRIQGDRAPASATLTLMDGIAGTRIGSLEADRSGKFDYRGRHPSPVCMVKIEVEGLELGPYPVRMADGFCGGGMYPELESAPLVAVDAEEEAEDEEEEDEEDEDEEEEDEDEEDD